MSRYASPNPWRVLAFYAALILSTAGLIVHLFQLQITEGRTYADEAFENRVTRVSDPAPRGIIYDRRGVPLVLAYTSTIYWIFRGKVKLDQSSY